MPFGYSCAFCSKLFELPQRFEGERCCSRTCRHALRASRTRTQQPPPAAEGTILLPLGHGRFTVIDAELAPLLNQWAWHYHRTSKVRDIGYAARTIAGGVMLYLHREILDAPDDIGVDHRNGDRLDNRRDNLRLANQTQNLGNAGGLWSSNTSGFRGVSFHKRTGRWRATIRVHGKQHELGTYRTPHEAALAYDQASRENFREFARQNHPDES